MKQFAFCVACALIVIAVGIFHQEKLAAYIGVSEPETSVSIAQTSTYAQLPTPDIASVSDEAVGEVFKRIGAQAVYIVDAQTGAKILELNQDARLYPASTVKLFTAAVATHILSPDQVVTVPQRAFTGTIAGLQPGEELTVSDLLAAMLIGSANDAAETLASAHPEGRVAFLAQMDELASELDIETSFLNSSGLDEDDQKVTAAQLSRIARYALQNPFIERYVAQQSVEITAFSPATGQERIITLQNTNQLLSDERVSGVKTGTTQLAGQVLVTRFQPSMRGQIQDFIIVVMGSQDRYSDTRQLFTLLEQQLEWQNLYD